jgi:hypothetical protein
MMQTVWRAVVEAVSRYFSSGPHRKMLRRRLLVFSLLPALLVLGIAAKLVTMVAYGESARSDFLRYDSYGLGRDVRKLKSFNVIDSYKAYFAEGDRYLLEGKLADAESEFKEALARVDQDESCPVRINLAVVLEALGDLKNADKHRDLAKPLWEEALKVVKEAPAGCFDTTTEPNEEQRKHRNDTEKRLQDKLKDQPPSNGQGQGQSGNGQSGGGQSGQDGQPPPGQSGQDGQPPPQPPGQSGQDGQPQPQQQSPGQSGQDGQSQPQPQSPGQSGQDGQAPAGPAEQAPNTVGADRIETDSGGVTTRQLDPRQGDPGDVLKRLLEDSNASGTDRE